MSVRQWRRALGRNSCLTGGGGVGLAERGPGRGRGCAGRPQVISGRRQWMNEAAEKRGAGNCRFDCGLSKRGKMVDSQYVLPNDVGISLLDCKEAFQLLSKEEKLYAHYVSRASWYGGLVVLLQTSPESPAIYVLLQKLFKAQPLCELQEAATALGMTSEEYQAFLVYAAGVYSNMGNYKSFGDTKFVPNLPQVQYWKYNLPA
uniref:dipeptidyl peptidase 3-like n=1 Tax=Pristiophorus japonicus TaxID=55135 RepID=UPI00398E9937